MLRGQCHCGEVSFQVPDYAVASSICYCNDCRQQSGAPMLAWAMFSKTSVSIDGKPKVYASSENGRRAFCASCGSGLFFTNAVLEEMGMMQVRIATLDDPDAIAPQFQAQAAERLKWVATAQGLPAFERFPG